MKIGIAGAGGIGSNVAMLLTRAGVNNLRIVDFDVVQESNLNRQFFFKSQIGLPKVDALADNLRRIDPTAHIETFTERVTVNNAAGFFADCGVVVEAFDGAEDKAMLVEAFAGAEDKFVVAASGVAGLSLDGIAVERRFGNVVVVGDKVSDVADYALYGAKVAACAASMTVEILKHMGFTDEK